MPQPNPNDIVATIKIDLYATGEMSIGGNIGDVTLATGMLDYARGRIEAKLKREQGRLIIPGRDVHVKQDPRFPTLPAGDMRR